MHIQAKKFTEFVKEILPNYFKNTTILDVGSGDINGNNKFLFDESCFYNGNDVIDAPNVTIVSKTSKLCFNDETFDIIVSTECFEHDPEYDLSFNKILQMLKHGGLFFFTCASTGRAEHGTRKTTPQDSYGTRGQIEYMQDYYKNLTELDVNEVINIKTNFFTFKFYYNEISKDLYFYGIKKCKNCENSEEVNLPDYKDIGIIDVTNNI